MTIQPTSPKKTSLQDAILGTRATIEGLTALLEKPVRVSLKSVDDYIEIEGCKEGISTEELSSQLRSYHSHPDDEKKKKLARLALEKVFIPLKEVVENQKNHLNDKIFYHCMQGHRRQCLFVRGAVLGLGAFSHADCILFLDSKMKEEVLRALK